MKNWKRVAALVLALTMLAPVWRMEAAAKTKPAGQTVDAVLFYVTNSAGEQVLVSHVAVSQMEQDLEDGKIDDTNHNYSLLDRYVTTVHQEAQGFTVPEFVAYARERSTLPSLRALNLTFSGQDTIRFWEIDQTGFDSLDTYTYDDLYGAARYNFPLLYQDWNYKTQDYYDPAGRLTRDETLDEIFRSGEPEPVLLAVRAFSQRYFITDGKYGTGNYNMENLWQTSGRMDNQRAIRVMKPMTKEELYNKTSTASDSRYWVANILLDMEKAPALQSLGTVAAPTAVMTQDEENYYIRFSCATQGATILYNQNLISPSYTPTCVYDGGAVTVPKSDFPSGTVTMTCRAVKDGWTDAGVVTLNLTASGTQAVWSNPYEDVPADSWYYDDVRYVTVNKLFDAAGTGMFGPDATMTRLMLAKALYRMAGSPAVTAADPFTDCGDPAVVWAYQAGVVRGSTATTFRPNASITREQITAMFYRYAQKVAAADMSARSELSGFTDEAEISDYAKDTMRWAVGAGLINGTTDTALSPQATATRAQTAAMVTRLEAYLG